MPSLVEFGTNAHEIEDIAYKLLAQQLAQNTPENSLVFTFQVVIGGGPVGLAAAYYSALAGRSVAVIERFSILNPNGSSNGASRQYRQMYADEYLAKFAQQSQFYWNNIEVNMSYLL